MEGPLVDDEGRSSPKTSVKLVDKNVSPAASKIAMLESVVYALHQQQMFQLELIEALRRQLATALAAAAASSRPAAAADDDDDVGAGTLDLTVPRANSSETAGGVDLQRSSLSSLMRLSAGVVAPRRAGVQSPSTSPGGTSDSHDATAVWTADLTSNKSSRLGTTSSLLPSTQKHAPPPPPPHLSDLSLFKKGELLSR